MPVEAVAGRVQVVDGEAIRAARDRRAGAQGLAGPILVGFVVGAPCSCCSVSVIVTSETESVTVSVGWSVSVVVSPVASLRLSLSAPPATMPSAPSASVTVSIRRAWRGVGLVDRVAARRIACVGVGAFSLPKIVSV